MPISSVIDNENNILNIRKKKKKANKDRKYPIVKVWELNEFVIQLSLIFSS